MRKLFTGAIVASIALVAAPVMAQDQDHGGPGGGDHHGGAMGDAHGNMGGARGNMGGAQGNMGGARGDMGGQRGAMGDHGMGGPGAMGDRNGAGMRGMAMGHGGPGMGGGHRFARGGRFNPGWAPGYRSVDSWQHYHLRRPPYGYHWVWYDGNFMLVAIGSGIIASIIAGAYN